MSLDVESGELTETEVDAFISHRWLVTVRKDESFPLDEVVARWDDRPTSPCTGSASSCTGCSMSCCRRLLRRRPGASTTATIRVSEDMLSETSDLAADAATPLVRDCGEPSFRFHRFVVPDARGRERA